jgi:prepilin-type N-terminal cleavage/methylation domain-containing protein
MQNTNCRIRTTDRPAQRLSALPSRYRLPSTAYRLPPTAPHGFTLVELLVTVSIMGILASMILFALSGAQESAKADKTRATINKLNSLVMAKYESYRTRRIPVDEKAVALYKGYISTTQTKTVRGLAETRVDVIRELMRMEMPDRYSDIQDGPVTAWADPVTGKPDYMARPSVNQAYYAYLITKTPNFEFEGAKCLYLLVSMGLDDPDVMSQFSDDEIAIDTNDGMRYFVDGWGQPIYFVRWPAGFSSPLQPWNVNPTDPFNNMVTSGKVYPTTYDPLDPLKTYVPGVGDPFYNPDPAVSANGQVYPPLYPLIFSGGPDRITDIYMNGISGSAEFHYSTTTPPNNPYVLVNNGLFGAPTDLSSIFTPSGVTSGDGVDNSIDNITNQDLSETQ